MIGGEAVKESLGREKGQPGAGPTSDITKPLLVDL